MESRSPLQEASKVNADDILDRAAVKVDVVTMHLEKQPGVFSKHVYKLNTFVSTERILTFTIDVTKSEFPIKTVDCYSYFDWTQPSLDLCFKVSKVKDNKTKICGHGSLSLLELFDEELKSSENIPVVGGRRANENKVSLSRYVRFELVKMPTMQRPIVLEMIVSVDSDLALLQGYRRLVQYKEIYRMLDPDFQDDDDDEQGQKAGIGRNDDEEEEEVPDERRQKSLEDGEIELIGKTDSVISSEILVGIDHLSHGDMAETLRKDKLSSTKIRDVILDMGDPKTNLGTRLVNQIFCTLCVDFMEDPVALPCGHRYCRNCSIVLTSECLLDGDISATCSACGQEGLIRSCLDDNYQAETKELVQLLREWRNNIRKKGDPQDQELLQWTESLIDFFLKMRQTAVTRISELNLSLVQRINLKEKIATFLDRLMI